MGRLCDPANVRFAATNSLRVMTGVAEIETFGTTGPTDSNLTENVFHLARFGINSR
jgi:hypothetical protein